MMHHLIAEILYNILNKSIKLVLVQIQIFCAVGAETDDNHTIPTRSRRVWYYAAVARMFRPLPSYFLELGVLEKKRHICGISMVSRISVRNVQKRPFIVSWFVFGIGCLVGVAIYAAVAGMFRSGHSLSLAFTSLPLPAGPRLPT